MHSTSSGWSVTCWSAKRALSVLLGDYARVGERVRSQGSRLSLIASADPRSSRGGGRLFSPPELLIGELRREQFLKRAPFADERKSGFQSATQHTPGEGHGSRGAYLQWGSLVCQDATSLTPREERISLPDILPSVAALERGKRAAEGLALFGGNPLSRRPLAPRSVVGRFSTGRPANAPCAAALLVSSLARCSS